MSDNTDEVTQFKKELRKFEVPQKIVLNTIVGVCILVLAVILVVAGLGMEAAKIEILRGWGWIH